MDIDTLYFYKMIYDIHVRPARTWNPVKLHSIWIHVSVTIHFYSTWYSESIF